MFVWFYLKSKVLEGSGGFQASPSSSPSSPGSPTSLQKGFLGINYFQWISREQILLLYQKFVRDSAPRNYSLLIFRREEQAPKSSFEFSRNDQDLDGRWRIPEFLRII